ncbi:MAG: GIY-YIG nuclease family protein [Nanoarchaeota archaeon]|nr:GIY-YIG nuclease family protein [Nanoarchaeota archaeon]
MKITGIYQILNVINGKRYIGSSVKIYGRWTLHKSRLRRNVHWNSHLQGAWNKYGEENFKFETIEECETENLLEREQSWMDYYQSYEKDMGYNLRKKASSNVGLVPWNKGKRGIYSEESRRMMSLSSKGQIPWNLGKKNPALGDKQLGEDNKMAKLTWGEVAEIRYKYENFNYSQEELAVEYGVVRTTIQPIVEYRTWVRKLENKKEKEDGI